MFFFVFFSSLFFTFLHHFSSLPPTSSIHTRHKRVGESEFHTFKRIGKSFKALLLKKQFFAPFFYTISSIEQFFNNQTTCMLARFTSQNRGHLTFKRNQADYFACCTPSIQKKSKTSFCMFFNTM